MISDYALDVLKVEVTYHKALRTDRCIATYEIKIAEIETDVKKDILTTHVCLLLFFFFLQLFYSFFI